MAFLVWITQLESVIMLIILIIFIGLFFIAAIKTPMLTFFKAFMSGKMVGAFFRGDRRLQFKTVKLEPGGIDDKTFGVIMVEPETVYNESKSGAPIITATSKVGAAISPDIVRATQRLKEMGIKNATEAEYINKRLHYCPTCDIEIIAKEAYEKDEHGVEVFDKFVCENHPLAELEKRSLRIDIPEENKSLDWMGVKNFLMSQANPILVRTMKERQLDVERQDLKSTLGGQMKLVGIGIFIFIVILGVVIFYMYMNNQASTDIVGQCKTLWDMWKVTGVPG